jgi:hypothetical protein
VSGGSIGEATGSMSTATSVPPTAGLQGDDALATLRATGRRRLGLDAFDRFRAADGVLGLAFAAQLEAVRAGVTATRFEREEN